MILGLDVSTSYLGWSILNNSGDLEKYGYVDFSKLGTDLFLKLDYFVSQMTDILQEYKDVVDTWGVEEAAKKFQGGKSTADVIATCTSFNFGVCYVVYSILGKEPTYIPVTSARKNVGLKIPRGLDKKDKKGHVIEWCKPRYPSIQWQLTRNGTYKEYMFDIADSLVISEATRQAWMTKQS